MLNTHRSLVCPQGVVIRIDVEAIFRNLPPEIFLLGHSVPKLRDVACAWEAESEADNDARIKAICCGGRVVSDRGYRRAEGHFCCRVLIMDLRTGTTVGRGCHVGCRRKLKKTVHGGGDDDDAD
jgi:hypothetical protein